MVVGTLQHVPSRGRISIKKIQNFTVQKRHSVIKLAYGVLLVLISIISAAINPIEIITNYFVTMREGSFIYNMWANPTYELFTEIWIYNYTNTKEFLDGTDKVMKLNEVGPFVYREMRTNDDMRVDKEKELLSMVPRLRLIFLKDKSVADPINITVTVPNIPLLALSTLAADKLGYLGNSGAYYSMSMLNLKPFKAISVHKMFWGYYDPLVTLANTILPGWIDFDKLGLLDRLYVQRNETAVVELNPSKRFALRTWDDSFGLKEQGYTDWNTSIPCNRIRGTFEGLMLPSNFKKGLGFTIFRKQACRSFPFSFKEEFTSDYGLNVYKYTMDQSAFSKSSPYACNCTDNCLPEGLIDISSCYYSFPISLSKPHYLDVDPEYQRQFEGMTPSAENDTSYYILEPTIGVPLEFSIKIQINLSVRSAPSNLLTKPLKDKVLPLAWLKMSCKSPPPDVIKLLRLRLVIGPPLFITIVVLLFTAGVILGVQGFYRVWRPRYKIIPPAQPLVPIVRRKSQERRRSSVHENIAFKEDDVLGIEAVSLLAINEDDNDFVELLISDDSEE